MVKHVKKGKKEKRKQESLNRIVNNYIQLLTMQKKTCSICLENVSRPAKLNQHCDCKYYVHYKCINTYNIP